MRGLKVKTEVEGVDLKDIVLDLSAVIL